MELPRVTRFCFCCSLRVGILTIGYVSLVLSVCAFFGIGLVVYLVARFIREGHPPPPGESPEDMANHATRLYVLHGLQILGQVYVIIINILLIIGAHKYKTRYLRWYFITGLVHLSYNLLMVVLFFVFVGFLATFPHLITSGFIFYFLLVVRSFYLEIEETEKPPSYEMVQTMA